MDKFGRTGSWGATAPRSTFRLAFTHLPGIFWPCVVVLAWTWIFWKLVQRDDGRVSPDWAFSLLERALGSLADLLREVFGALPLPWRQPFGGRRGANPTPGRMPTLGRVPLE